MQNLGTRKFPLLFVRSSQNVLHHLPSVFLEDGAQEKVQLQNSIREKLLPNKIAVVLFDVWKHEGDALRRTFLKESVRQLKTLGEDYFDQSFQIDERLEQSVSRSSEGRVIVNKEK